MTFKLTLRPNPRSPLDPHRKMLKKSYNNMSLPLMVLLQLTKDRIFEFYLKKTRKTDRDYLYLMVPCYREVKQSIKLDSKWNFETFFVLSFFLYLARSSSSDVINMEITLKSMIFLGTQLLLGHPVAYVFKINWQVYTSLESPD